MRISRTWLPLLTLGLCLVVSSAQSRRIRVQRPLQDDAEEEETVQYYAAEPQDERDPRQRVVLVSAADQYNGLYGQPTASSRQDNYIPRGSSKSQGLSPRGKESSKEPPVQTIRNYNKVNDDGSFTFGYEAADGSFKEETRGTDCVVRGKYGYVDPDGNKREFTYVSGNPCDPNAPKEEQDEQDEESAELPGASPNYPTRPVRPIPRPVSTPRPVTVFQNAYVNTPEEEETAPEQLLRATPAPVRRPQYIQRPQYYAQQDEEEVQTYQRPQIVPTSTPASVIYRQSLEPVSITPRPLSASASPSTRHQLPATTYRPQLLQVSTPRPQIYYTKQIPSPSTTPKPINLESELQRFQSDNHIASPSPQQRLVTTPRPSSSLSPNGQIYSSALVYDPATGQYNTQLYQTLPQTDGDINLSQRLQPFVYQPQAQRPAVNPVRTSPAAAATPAPQAAYLAKQAQLQYQNSAQLYAQQSRVRQQQQQTAPRQQQQQQQQTPAAAPPPLFYYQAQEPGALSSSQIDAFLRGHNIQF